MVVKDGCAVVERPELSVFGRLFCLIDVDGKLTLKR